MTGQPKNGWIKCEPGELERLEQRLWFRRVKQLVVTAVAAVAASGAVALAAWEVGHVVVPSVWTSSSPGQDCAPRVVPICPEDVPQQAAPE